MTLTCPSRRQLMAVASTLAAASFAGCSGAQTTHRASTRRLRLIGETRLPHKLAFQNTTVGGLSGIDFDPASGLYYLLSDDGGSQSPPRFYTARLAFTSDKLGAIELTSVTLLQGLSAPDPEAIRWHAPSQSLLWTSEGNALLGAQPSLQQARPDGALIRKFALPAMFDFGLLSGSRINSTFEGLAATPDGLSAWLAMEAALRQDGPEPTIGAPGGPCRFTQIDVATGKSLRQIAYVPDAIPKAPFPPNANADNGVVEVLMLDAHRMLVLERAYMAGLDDKTSNSLRLYLIDTRQASDTLSVAALKPGNHTPAAKTLVADFASFPALTQLDNTEGMCWGPNLPNSNGKPGNRTLLFVSDDNFNPRQITQFLAFEFLE
ncbi:MAG: esterase-like activity of phytase family protein [Vitreoscilla sp.]|nr:esterase-like activity of phytase family protein [Polaromonas sp.]